MEEAKRAFAGPSGQHAKPALANAKACLCPKYSLKGERHSHGTKSIFSEALLLIDFSLEPVAVYKQNQKFKTVFF